MRIPAFEQSLRIPSSHIIFLTTPLSQRSSAGPTTPTTPSNPTTTNNPTTTTNLTTPTTTTTQTNPTTRLAKEKYERVLAFHRAIQVPVEAPQKKMPIKKSEQQMVADFFVDLEDIKVYMRMTENRGRRVFFFKCLVKG
jgi:hypothetical protein